MDANDVLALGLGVTPPWRLVSQRLDTATQPHQLHLEVAAERGALFPCPACGKPCKAHDFAEFTWRHLNFFQHHCYVTAKVPRTDCPEDGVLRITVPWAREGSRFTLLFEQAALMLVREMPVLATARLTNASGRLMRRLAKADLLILDDWAMTDLTAQQRRDLMEIVDDRHDRRSIVLASQVPVDRWHDMIGDPTYADAILDRIVHNATRVELKGESLRKTRADAMAAAN